MKNLTVLESKILAFTELAKSTFDAAKPVEFNYMLTVFMIIKCSFHSIMAWG
jgi:hypothetical protein